MSEDGREVTVYRVPKGEICALSASCAINSITFDLFIDADDDTELMIINMIFFRKLMDSNIWFKNFIYELISARFSDVMWIMQQILFSSFDKRLAVFLLDEFDSAGEDILKMTHEQIAKYVGSAREVVSRMLKYFEREEIVQLSRGGIKLIDRKALENILG
jgi:CRP/FNR family transcriptional regulator